MTTEPPIDSRPLWRRLLLDPEFSLVEVVAFVIAALMVWSAL